MYCTALLSSSLFEIFLTLLGNHCGVFFGVGCVISLPKFNWVALILVRSGGGFVASLHARATAAEDNATFGEAHAESSSARTTSGGELGKWGPHSRRQLHKRFLHLPWSMREVRSWGVPCATWVACGVAAKDLCMGANVNLFGCKTLTWHGQVIGTHIY